MSRRTDLDGEIVANYKPMFRFAMKLVRSHSAALDLTQDTMERAMTNAHLYKDGPNGKGNLKGWMWLIMRRTHISNHRAPGRGCRETPYDPKSFEVDTVDTGRVRTDRVEVVRQLPFIHDMGYHEPNQYHHLRLKEVLEEIEKAQLPRKLKSDTSPRDFDAPPGVCAHCGNDFQPHYSHCSGKKRQLYCSKNCRENALYAKKRKRKSPDFSAAVKALLDQAITGDTVEELAKRHNTVEGTIKSRCFRGREILEKADV